MHLGDWGVRGTFFKYNYRFTERQESGVDRGTQVHVVHLFLLEERGSAYKEYAGSKLFF